MVLKLKLNMKEPQSQVYNYKEINAAIEAVKTGHWTEGKYSREFARALCAYLGRKYTVLTNSGSSANLAAVMALTTHWIPEARRLKEGDEVITTALCFPTTISPIIYAKCIPVFVDVEPITWNIDCGQLEKAITKKTKAIILAHNLGNPFNVDKIVDICKRHNLWLIEDNCDSLGSKWGGKLTGSFGDIATSSFYPAHHISVGEGGAVYTDNPLIYRAVQSMVNWGRDCYCPPGVDNTCCRRFKWKLGNLPEGYDHKNIYAELGFNLKMNDIQAAIGTEQLKKLPRFIVKRKYNHQQLFNLFAQYKWFDLPFHNDFANPSWFGYVVKLNRLAPFKVTQFIEYLENANISCRAFFAGNMTKQPALFGRKVKYKVSGKLIVSDNMMESSFWLRVHPGIGKKYLDYMKYKITTFLELYK